jgi:hypothetical protein
VGLHLIVIGSRPDDVDPIDQFMDVVASSIRETASFVMARATRAASLLDIVAFAAKHTPIEVLDVFDHGTHGYQWLGDGPVFGFTAKDGLIGGDTAAGLAPYLADTAHVRLLGCGIADDDPRTTTIDEGRVMLYRLGELLGGRRTMFGTVRAVVPAAFDAAGSGFLREMETDFLFSSRAALDRSPPDWEERKDNIKAMNW